jgi:hypothetical protein
VIKSSAAATGPRLPPWWIALRAAPSTPHSQLAYSGALNDEVAAIALAFWTRPQVRRPAGITVKRVLIDKRQRNIGRA